MPASSSVRGTSAGISIAVVPLDMPKSAVMKSSRCAGDSDRKMAHPIMTMNKRRGRRNHGAASGQRGAQKQSVKGEEEAVIGAPQNEIPARAMPKAGGEKAYPEIDVGANVAVAVAAHRYI